MTNNTNNHPAGGLHSKCIQPCTQETCEPGQPSESSLDESTRTFEKLAQRPFEEVQKVINQFGRDWERLKDNLWSGGLNNNYDDSFDDSLTDLGAAIETLIAKEMHWDIHEFIAEDKRRYKEDTDRRIEEYKEWKRVEQRQEANDEQE